LFQVALSAAYYSILPVINAGQTPGKMLAGIAIVRQDGAPLTYVHSFVRWIGYLISGIAMGLGFALVLFTPLKRGVHDYVAGTRVVQVEQVSPSRRRGVILFGVASLLLAIVVGFLAATQP
jgi:uncharacterized RDD family membrane protein YckC